MFHSPMRLFSIKVIFSQNVCDISNYRYVVSLFSLRPVIMVSISFLASRAAFKLESSVGRWIVSSPADQIWDGFPKTIEDETIPSGLRFSFITLTITASRISFKLIIRKFLLSIRRTKRMMVALSDTQWVVRLSTIFRYIYLVEHTKDTNQSRLNSLCGLKFSWGGLYISKTNIPWTMTKIVVVDTLGMSKAALKRVAKSTTWRRGSFGVRILMRSTILMSPSGNEDIYFSHMEMVRQRSRISALTFAFQGGKSYSDFII